MRRDGGGEGRGVKRGTLYLVATPIGNLEDITLRALRILGEVDLVACEDTRRTQHLLERHRVRKRLVSYFGAREKEKARALIGFLREGKSVALVSDAGMPGISDPGALVARMAIAEGFDVVPVPGPVALAAALAASGLDTSRFCFEGFLPRGAQERRARLAALTHDTRTLVFHESPRRLAETLREMLLAMGDREAAVARELTKIHEEFARGTLSGIIGRVGEGEVKGEVVIVLAGAKEETDWGAVDLPAYVKHLEERLSIDRKAALKLAAQLSGISKSDLYRHTR